MEQAENRLHLQKGLMSELVKANEARGRTAQVAGGDGGDEVGSSAGEGALTASS